MKKWMIFLFAAILTGCSEPVSTVYESTSNEEREQQREQIDVKVHVYSLEQNNAGYIMKWDERDKWVITNASVVYQHPKALIETSNKQLLEGDVVYLDVETNIAVLHFRNSTDVLFEQYADSSFKVSSGVPTEFVSFNKENIPLTANEASIDILVGKIGKEPLSFEKRMVTREYLQSFPKVKVNERNKIETYEKSTFSFDQDRIHLAANSFFEQYNTFVYEQPSTILDMIANDQLRTVFDEWEVFGETYAFDDIKIMTIQNANFQYIVQFESTMDNKSVKIGGTLYFTQINEELFVTSFVFKEI
jgi:hypothetical protein